MGEGKKATIGTRGGKRTEKGWEKIKTLNEKKGWKESEKIEPS